MVATYHPDSVAAVLSSVSRETPNGVWLPLSSPLSLSARATADRLFAPPARVGRTISYMRTVVTLSVRGTVESAPSTSPHASAAAVFTGFRLVVRFPETPQRLIARVHHCVRGGDTILVIILFVA